MRTFWLVALGSLTAFEPVASAAPPNVIVIIVDDLGWADVGYHGQSDIPTPAIDALVANGVELRQFYTSPDGFQTRAAMLTGRWPLRYGLQGLVGKSRDEPGLPVAERTLAEELQDLGYGTYLLGNWGLGSDEKYRPTDRGFDHHYGSYGDAVDQYGHCDPRAKLDWYRDGALNFDDGWAPDLLVDEAIEILNAEKGKGPVYLQVALPAPHKPYQAPQKYIAMPRYQTAEKPERRSYETTVAAMDESIGRLVAEVDKLGLAGDTAFFFLSDNGGDSANGMASNLPLRGSSGPDQVERVYDGALRVPAAMTWRGTIEPGVLEAPTQAVDLFPTILAIAGGSPSTPLDGFDLRRPSTFQPRSIPLELSKRYAVIRSGKWQLVAKREESTPGSAGSTTAAVPGQPATLQSTLAQRMTMLMSDDPSTWTPTTSELYDIDHDPTQSTNLAAANPAVVEALLDDVRTYLQLAQPPGKPPTKGSNAGGTSGGSTTTEKSGLFATPPDDGTGRLQSGSGG
jgi:arylsulfatase A-like enzyme